MKKAVRRASPAPLKWLLLCFPYGLYLMWRGRWHMAAKLGVSALFAAAALGILLFPAPERAAATKVVLVGAKPEAEVFGPALPVGYDPADYYVDALDDLVIAATAEDDTVYVYASANAGSTYYHTSLCKYAYASSMRMTLYESYALGFRTPCQRCNPPIYIPEGN